MKKGTHILADLYQCQGSKNLLTKKESLKKLMIEVIKKVGLGVLDSIFYQFPKAGVTGVVLLAESHLAIHTWPEKKYLTLDIFVCNLTRDNTKRAHRAFKMFLGSFRPLKVKKKILKRE